MSERILRHVVYALIYGVWKQIGVPTLILAEAQATRDFLIGLGLEAEVRGRR